MKKEKNPKNKAKISREFLQKIENQLIQKYQKREIMKELKIQEMQNSCPFTPALAIHSREIISKKKLRPIHQRYKTELKKKEKKIKKKRELRKKVEQFRERKSMKKFKRKKTKSKIGLNQRGITKSRDLYKQGRELIKKKHAKIYEEQARQIELQFEENEDYFKPKINEYSKSVVKSDFEERQKMFKRRKIRNKRKLKKRNCSYSFKPKLNKKSLDMYEENSDRNSKVHTSRPRQKRKRRKGYSSSRGRTRSNNILKESGFSLDPYFAEESGSFTEMEKYSKRRGMKHSPIFKKKKILQSRSKNSKRRRPSKKALKKLFNNVGETDPKVLTNRSSQGWKRLYKTPGRSARGSLIVAARPEKEGQAALTYRQKRPPKVQKMNSFRNENNENEYRNVNQRRRNNYDSARVGKKRKRNHKRVVRNKLDFEEFEEFCNTFSSLRGGNNLESLR